MRRVYRREFVIVRYGSYKRVHKAMAGERSFLRNRRALNTPHFLSLCWNGRGCERPRTKIAHVYVIRREWWMDGDFLTLQRGAILGNTSHPLLGGAIVCVDEKHDHQRHWRNHSRVYAEVEKHVTASKMAQSGRWISTVVYLYLYQLQLLSRVSSE